MQNPLHRVRHIGRYREIISQVVRFGFGDMIYRIGLFERLNLPRQFGMLSSEHREKPTPVRFRLLLEALGPTFIKLGQVLSTRPDLLPASFILEMVSLQDAVPPAPWDVMQEAVEAGLGQPLDDLFDHVDPTPLGSASLAQVHAAKLKDGPEVVIKAQRPNIERQIQIDLEILLDMATLFQQHTPLGEVYDFPTIARDFASTLHSELDYRREASYADRFRRNFADDPDVHIPLIYWEYVTPRVLVMERLVGVKIDDLAGLEQAGYAPKSVAEKCVRLLVREVLDDGFFHADPHPGNFVVMEGEVIGAMDFGMVGWLEKYQRIDLSQLYVAAVSGNTDAVVSHLIRMGITGHSVDRTALRRDVSRLLNKYRGILLDEINLQEVFDDVMSIAFTHHLQLPSDLWLLGKTLVMMEGIGSHLDPDLDVFALSEPYVERLKRDMMKPETWGPPIVRAISDWAYMLREMPSTGGQILSQLEQGELEIGIIPRGLGETLRVFERVADRLAISILMASLIIGLALVLPAIADSPQWGWLEVLVIFIFVVVAALGVWLLFSLLWRRGKLDRRRGGRR